MIGPCPFHIFSKTTSNVHNSQISKFRKFEAFETHTVSKFKKLQSFKISNSKIPNMLVHTITNYSKAQIIRLTNIIFAKMVWDLFVYVLKYLCNKSRVQSPKFGRNLGIAKNVKNNIGSQALISHLKPIINNKNQ